MINEFIRAAKQRRISAMWHPTKNGDLTPNDVEPGTVISVWWQGECGHEWYRPVFKQVNNPDCPYCTNKELLEGFNDLETLYPENAEDWHPWRNNGLLPKNVIANRQFVAWWQCKICGQSLL